MADNLAKKIEDWLRKQVQDRGARGLVVGLSGGIDSAVTAALCKNVCPDTTLGVIMPCYSDPQDAEHAELLAKTIGIKYKKVVLDEVFAKMVMLLTGEEYDPGKQDITIANIKPRLRMTTLYFYAARMQGLVVGTGNRSELTVGYFTKYGDGGVDLLPIANLVKKEVRELARLLGIPETIINKPPSAGLWRGQNDESEMGITYDELDNYILTGQASDRVRKIVDEMARKSLHKKQLPAIPPVQL
ncbi:NAD(+) synthase [Desulfallas sp. Bu1-1]|uniref:NAD(+) synthase n=1 Tax=Desulfallas sp. Bu1-1 TaxID=2787620 RepID=UPI001FAE52CD|nr:NAD(+) synthase [Desulfallas sp. Bu1-1]